MEVAGERYKYISRIFRNKWGWSPKELKDETALDIERMYEEYQIDFPETENGSSD